MTAPTNPTPNQATATSNDPWYILGAGAIGGLWAWQLHQWQIPVSLLLKGVKAVRQHQQAGLYVTRANQATDASANIYNNTPNAAAISLPSYSPQLLKDVYPSTLPPLTIRRLLICTKAQDTLRALKQWQSCITSNVDIMLLQNGMGNAQTIQTLLPRANIYAGISTDGAYRVAASHLVWAGQGNTKIGAFSPHLEARKTPAWLTPVLDASARDSMSLQVAWHDDIHTLIWHKLAVNSAINGLTAIYGIQNGELIDHPLARPRMEQLCQETEDVMSRSRITPIAHGLLNRVLLVLQQTTANKSSMRQDIEAGRTTEIDYINGYIMRQGATFYLHCPGHQQVHREVLALQRNATLDPHHT